MTNRSNLIQTTIHWQKRQQEVEERMALLNKIKEGLR